MEERKWASPCIVMHIQCHTDKGLPVKRDLHQAKLEKESSANCTPRAKNGFYMSCRVFLCATACDAAFIEADSTSLVKLARV